MEYKQNRKPRTKLKIFIDDNQINMFKLLNENICLEALKLNEYPMCWATFHRLVYGQIDVKLSYMNMIRNGISVYLNRDVKMEELFNIYL